LGKNQSSLVYDTEADVLNPNEKGNIRDYATIQQLVVLSNLESINAILIAQTIPQNERLIQLNKIAITQMKSLVENQIIKQIGKNE
jgi:hypothetical protein